MSVVLKTSATIPSAAEVHESVYGWAVAIVLIGLGMGAIRSSLYLRAQQARYRHVYGATSWLLGALSTLCLIITAAALWYGMSAAWRVITGSSVFLLAPLVSLILAVAVLAIPIYIEWQMRLRDK